MSRVVPASDRLKQQRNFTRVPNEIIEHDELSPQAKMVWIELWKFCFHDGDGVFPGMEKIGEDLNYHKNTVRKYRHELEDANLLRVKRRGQGKTNIYYLYTPSGQNQHRQDSDPQGKLGQDQTTYVREEDEVEEDKVNTYISPTKEARIEGSESMNIYLKMFRNYVGGKHGNVPPSTYREASAILEKHYFEWDEDNFIDTLREYFENFNYETEGLPKLPYFIEVSDRFFL